MSLILAKVWILQSLSVGESLTILMVMSLRFSFSSFVSEFYAVRLNPLFFIEFPLPQ